MEINSTLTKNIAQTYKELYGTLAGSPTPKFHQIMLENHLLTFDSTLLP